jgi:hypothetical protein
MFKTNVKWGVVVGIAVWGIQIGIGLMNPQPIVMPPGSTLFDLPGLGSAIVECVLISLGLGALTAGWDAGARLGSAMRAGAFAAGFSYVATHYIPAAFQFVPMALEQLGVGIDPAFVGFVEHALLSLTGNELVFVGVAALGGACGGALLVVGRVRNWPHVPAPRVG